MTHCEVNVQICPSSRCAGVARLLSSRGIWDLSDPEGAPSIYSPFLELYRHYWCNIQHYSSQKDIRGKQIFSSLLLACYVHLTVLCLVSLSLLIYNWWVNREEEKAHMYILTEFRWKKRNCLKGRSWEKWAFLKLVPTNKKTPDTISF